VKTSHAAFHLMESEVQPSGRAGTHLPDGNCVLLAAADSMTSATRQMVTPFFMSLRLSDRREWSFK
jgi:hypothetical protein